MQVVVVAEDRLAARGLRALLDEAGLTADAVSAAEADARLDAGEAEVAVVDGAAELAGTWVALVDDGAGADAARAAGALGVLHREVEPVVLAAALQAVVLGLVVVDPLFVEAVGAGAGPQTAVPGYEPLTPRESEVLEHLALGLSNREIGEELGISQRTARFHVAAILEKLGAQTRTEAVVLAARAGLVVL